MAWLIWNEVNIHHDNNFFLVTFYRPPNSSAQTLSSIEDSISFSFDSNIKNVFVTGDFNLATLKSSIYKTFATYVSNQLTLPKTDLVFTSNKDIILLSGVGDPFLESK